MGLIADPPAIGVESEKTVNQYYAEKADILLGLKNRANMLTDNFNKMVNMSCTDI